jgi:hypothetical protein
MSAYRRAPIRAVPSIRLACAACGAFADIAATDDSFQCETCHTDQPARRPAGRYEPAQFRAKGHVEAAYGELGAFASALGIEASCGSVDVECDGLVCEVSIGLNSGSVTGVDYAMTAPGFPSIELRHESTDEVDAKRGGITHEAQTGDAAFDEAVFIASDHSDEEVLAVLSAPAVRAAILELLNATRSVSLVPNGVRMHIAASAPGAFDPGSIRACVARMRVIAGAPRRIEGREPPPDTWGTTAAGAMITAVFLAPLLVIGAHGLWTPVTSAPTMTGLVAGLVLALAVQPLLRRKIRGRSDSHTSLAMGRTASAVWMPALTIIMLLAINALFDRSRERAHEVEVASVSYDNENNVAKATVRASGADASLHGQEFEFEDPQKAIAVGQRLTAMTKRGALGWEWRSSPAKLRVGQTVMTEK